MKILIADDEALSRRLLEKTLERAGYEVIAVEDGKKAFEQLCQPEGPRLALLDWVMPEMDGPAVCRTMRKANRANVRLHHPSHFQRKQRRHGGRAGSRRR